MSTHTQAEGLQVIAEAINEALAKLYGEPMGFFLCVANFSNDGEEGRSDYICNSQRESAIKWLRETADRLEKQEIDPPGEDQE